MVNLVEVVRLPRRPILCCRGDQNAADESKIFRRRIQGFHWRVLNILLTHPSISPTCVQRFYCRRSNAPDVTSYHFNIVHAICICFKIFVILITQFCVCIWKRDTGTTNCRSLLKVSSCSRLLKIHSGRTVQLNTVLTYLEVFSHVAITVQVIPEFVHKLALLPGDHLKQNKIVIINVHIFLYLPYKYNKHWILTVGSG